MVITESAVPSAQLLGVGSKLYLSNMQHVLSKDDFFFFLKYAKIIQVKEKLW